MGRMKEITIDCEHTWVYAGTAKDGTTFYKCRKCGLTEEM